MIAELIAPQEARPMSARFIDVAKDFAAAPGPRFARSGPNSGEAFRKKVLAPAIAAALQSHGTVRVRLDGAAGYGVSFLEEAFGGLVRREGFTAEQLSSTLSIDAESAAFRPFRDLALRYIREAKPEVAH